MRHATPQKRPLARTLLAALAAALVFGAGVTRAQAPGGVPPALADPSIADAALADAALANEAAAEQADSGQAVPPTAAAPLWKMVEASWWLLTPIVLLSIAVVAVAVERTLGLRRSRVAPRRLVRRLREQVELGDVDPASSRAICERHPSAAADVVLAMLAKVGRPHPEVEAAASEEIDRQADRLYANVRTLNLAAAVAPLMGLLGTVWGMIEAFFVTASLPIEANKGQALAQGIYTALFTTFAGLAVAIPAAVLAHLFEGRILRLMRRIEQLVAELLPCLERFEGERRHLLTTGAAGVGGVGLPDDGLTNDGSPDDSFATRSDPAWAAVPGNHSTPAVSPTPPAPQS